MSSTNDPRRKVGTTVYTRARLVLNDAECRRIYGDFYKTAEIPGTVVSVETVQRNKRSVTNIVADWTVPGSVKRRSVNLAAVKDRRTASHPLPAFSMPPTNASAPPQRQNGSENNAAAAVTPATSAPARASTSEVNERDCIRQQIIEAHGRKWASAQVTEPLNGAVRARAWSVSGPANQIITETYAPRDTKPLDFFTWMVPQAHLARIVDATTARLRRKSLKPTSTGEVLIFFGALLAITRAEFKDRRSFWGENVKSKRHRKQVNLSPDISIHRFEELASQLSFSAIQNPIVEGRWCEVEGFLQAINAHRHATVTPSELLCVDESISRWYGPGGDHIDVGLPHYVKLDRKPESGCEIKNSCCARSGIILTMEISKSSAETSERDYEGESPHGTATVLPLVEPWFQTDRHVNADAGFASVTTALELWKVGLRFKGPIKAVTRLYPMAHLSAQVMPRKGNQSSVVSGSVTETPQLIALFWTDRDRRYFICSCGTTTPGTPIYRERSRNVDGRTFKVGLEIPIPLVCEKYSVPAVPSIATTNVDKTTSCWSEYSGQCRGH